MPGDDETDFQSFAPKVGRIKSKRWVGASSNYDGGDWGDEYSDEEEQVPEMPAIPDHFNSESVTSHESTSTPPVDLNVPLELGTRAQRRTEAREKEIMKNRQDLETSSDETGQVAIDDAIPVPDEQFDGINNRHENGLHAEKNHHMISAPEDKSDYVDPHHNVESKTIADPYIGTAAKHDRAEPKFSSHSESLNPDNFKDIHESAAKYDPEPRITAENSFVKAVRGPRPAPDYENNHEPRSHPMEREPINETDDTDDIYDYYETAESNDQFASQGRPLTKLNDDMEKLDIHQTLSNSAVEDSEITPRASENSHVFSGSFDGDNLPIDASNSSGRWEPVEQSIPQLVASDREIRETTPSTRSVSDANTSDQAILTRQILGSLSDPTTFDETSGDDQPDPELRALYENSSQFLTRPISQYDSESVVSTEPLTTHKSKSSVSSAWSNEFESREDDAEKDTTKETIHDTAHESMHETVRNTVHEPVLERLDAPVDDQSSVLDPEEKTPVISEVPMVKESPKDNIFKGFDSSNSPEPGGYGSSEARSIISNDSRFSQSETTSTRNSTIHKIQDSITEKVESEKAFDIPAGKHSRNTSTNASNAAIGAGLGLTVGGLGVAQLTDNDEKAAAGPVRKSSRNNTISLSERLNRAPKFDFSAALSKRRPEERVALFIGAIDKELEWSSGLQNWLEATYAANQPMTGVYPTGKPPPPTQQEARLAVPSRTMSTSIIKPAKHISKEAFGRVGEKSKAVSSSLFARGKKFIKTTPGN